MLRYGGGQTDEVAVKKHIDTLNGKLDTYEKILGKQKYLGGNEVTLADLAHIPYGSMLYTIGHGDVIDSRPNVKRYML